MEKPEFVFPLGRAERELALLKRFFERVGHTASTNERKYLLCNAYPCHHGELYCGWCGLHDYPMLLCNCSKHVDQPLGNNYIRDIQGVEWRRDEPPRPQRIDLEVWEPQRIDLDEVAQAADRRRPRLGGRVALDPGTLTEEARQEIRRELGRAMDRLSARSTRTGRILVREGPMPEPPQYLPAETVVQDQELRPYEQHITIRVMEAEATRAPDEPADEPPRVRGPDRA